MDWIEHDGKSRPNLPAGTLVVTKQSNGWSDENHRNPKSWEWWDEEDDLGSSWINVPAEEYPYITAYKVVS